MLSLELPAPAALVLLAEDVELLSSSRLSGWVGIDVGLKEGSLEGAWVGTCEG
jgi:hypothetical protein